MKINYMDKKKSILEFYEMSSNLIVWVRNSSTLHIHEACTIFKFMMIETTSKN